MKAANEESTESYFCIGNCYLNGLGVEKDEKEAARWFLKAAELGLHVPLGLDVSRRYRSGTEQRIIDRISL